MLKAAVIRRAVPGDWFELGALQARSYHDAYRKLLPNAFLSKVTAESRQADCRERLRDELEYTAILLVDNRAAGYISLRFPAEGQDGEGEITALYLLREYWRYGLGKRLMAWGIERLQERGCTSVALWVLEKNAGARRFYEGQGFLTEGLQRDIVRGDAFIQVRYEKEIEA